MVRDIPKDTDVERSILGACIISKSAMIKCLKGLDEESFYEEKNRLVFKAISRLASEGHEVDFISLSNALGAMLETVGSNYITTLPNYVSSTSGPVIDTYIDLLDEKKAQRKAIELGSIITEMGFSGEKDINEKIREKAVSFTKIEEDEVGMKEAFEGMAEQEEQFRKNLESGKAILGDSTGIKKLDDTLGGIMPGLFYVVAGYTSSGKTQLTLNIVNSLLEQGKRVLFMSLEMSPRQVGARMVAIDSGEAIDSVRLMYDRFNNKELTQEQKLAILRSKNKLKDYPILISMNSSWTALKAKMAEIAIMKNFDVIVIDFLQNLQSKEDEYTKLTNISVDLQSFCNKTQCTVIATSQIPKDAQINKYDDVITLKGSGSIGEKADVVMLISYDTKSYKKEEFDAMKANNEPLPVILNIQKQREGRTGAINLRFKTWTGKFTEGEYDDL